MVPDGKQLLEEEQEGHEQQMGNYCHSVIGEKEEESVIGGKGLEDGKKDHDEGEIEEHLLPGREGKKDIVPEKSEQYPECYKPYNKGQCHGFAIFGLDQGSSIADGGDKQKKHCSGQRAFDREVFSHPTLLLTQVTVL